MFFKFLRVLGFVICLFLFLFLGDLMLFFLGFFELDERSGLYLDLVSSYEFIVNFYDLVVFRLVRVLCVLGVVSFII